VDQIGEARGSALTNREDIPHDDDAIAADCFLLPGKTMYLSHLLHLKSFGEKGNKDGDPRAFHKLEEEGLEKMLEVGDGKGTNTASGCEGVGFIWRPSIMASQGIVDYQRPPET